MPLRFPKILVFVSLVLIAAVSPQPADATLFVRVADEFLASQATVIVQGRVLEVDSQAGGRQPLTHYRVEAERIIQGHLPSSVFTVRSLGGTTSDGYVLRPHGIPIFAPERQVLLFLNPHDDGTWSILHLMQGAFHIDTLPGGRAVAWRDFSDSREVPLPQARTLHPEGPRDLERFIHWLEQQADSAKTPQDPVIAQDYFIDDDVPFDKFTFITDEANGFPVRWREFDTGGNVRWRANSSGQPGLPSGGFTEFQTALQVWTDEPSTPIRLFYGGQTSASAGLTAFDGENVILWNDPNNEIPNTFSCATGGTLAVASPWYQRVLHTFRGASYNTVGGGDIITNRGIACALNAPNYAEEIFGHELGHTLGLGHSCGDDRSGPCNTAIKDEALMRADIHGDGRGARLGADDLAGIRALYELANQAPDAPGNLRAEALGPGLVELRWNDNSTDENGFEIERSIEGAEFTALETANANAVLFEDATATSGRLHTYRVRAVNSNGRSSYSNQASATTPGEFAPTDLTAAANSTTGILLRWTDNALTEAGYQVEFRPAPTSDTEPPADFTPLATLDPDTTEYQADGLEIGTAYGFRVRSLGGVGDSSYTSEASAITFLRDPEECVPSASTLCLNDGRFQVEVDWRNFEDTLGIGQAVDLGDVTSDDSGLLYFFNPDNWEMLIKVIDGCGFNDRFWVFAAATTDVEYTLTVTDMLTGFTQEYINPLGVASAALTDIEAFATCAAEAPAPLDGATRSAAPSATSQVKGFLEQLEALGGHPATVDSATAVRDGKGTCDPAGGDTTLCLQGDRFSLTLDWVDGVGNTGQGHVVPITSTDSGLLWFFDADNWEMLVKVIDGCGFNDRYWVFAAATTNVEYTLTVTDTEGNAVRQYVNPQGNAADALTDTDAFATCP